MADERKKISELEEVSSLIGDENLLLGVTGGNKRVTVRGMKDYIGDSKLLVFTEVVTGVQYIAEGAPTPENGAVIEVVYLNDMSLFVARKTVNGFESYFSTWNGSDSYLTDGNPREDRVYYCIEERCLYVWDGITLERTDKDFTEFSAEIAVALADEIERATEAEKELNDRVTSVEKSQIKLQESTEEEIENMIANGTWKEGVIYYTVEE